MTILAFTGTRKGMTKAQRRTLRHHLMTTDKRPTVAHHGRCVGADEDMHDLLLAAKVPVETWPGDIEDLRAPCLGAAVDHEPMSCLARNQRIVEACDYLIVAPAGYTEERRSGTWATARAAREMGKPVYVVLPDGRFGRWK
jgi:hypothetical protein